MHDTDTTITTPDVPGIDRDWIGYKVGRAPKHLASAAVWGAHEGMVSSADLPDVPAQDVSVADYLRYSAALHKVLDDTGVLGAYRAYLMVNARPAVCPFWCWGQHPTIADSDDFREIVHEMPVSQLRFDENAGQYLAGKEMEISIQQWQSPEMTQDAQDEISIHFAMPGNADIDTLNESAARSIGGALAAAADRLAEVKAAADAG